MNIKQNIDEVCGQINAACLACNRSSASVQLLAVSKTKPIEAIEEAYHQAGLRAFGENYVQEGVDKIQALASCPGIEWYFIGPLQSNKAKPVAEHFDWVLTLDRGKIAKRLNDLRPSEKGPLNVCVQVNISCEASKSGLSLDELETFALSLSQYPNLTLRGLMAIPDPSLDEGALRQAFLDMKAAFDRLQSQVSTVDTLSMGMSGDMALAIECGSTQVRVGTAIFGKREQRTA